MSRADELPRFTAIDWHRCQDDPEGLMCRHEDAERVIRELESDRAALLAIVKAADEWRRAFVAEDEDDPEDIVAAEEQLVRALDALPETLRMEVTGG